MAITRSVLRHEIRLAMIATDNSPPSVALVDGDRVIGLCIGRPDQDDCDRYTLVAIRGGCSSRLSSDDAYCRVVKAAQAGPNQDLDGTPFDWVE